MTVTGVVLEAERMGRSFGGRPVLKEAGFRATAGTITALMGRNGTGKSTLLQVAVGRVRADYGRVSLRGRVLPRPRLPELAREGIFYAAQRSALTDLFTVRQHLEAVARAFPGCEPDDGVDDLAGRSRIASAATGLALEGLMDLRPRSLSGGERQRVSLAMAAVRDPACLLMDEPFSGVAPVDRSLVTHGLESLRDRGCAIVVSGHDVEDLFGVADEVVWLVDGVTHDLGPPPSARLHPRFQRDYLGEGTRTPRAAHFPGNTMKRSQP